MGVRGIRARVPRINLIQTRPGKHGHTYVVQEVQYERLHVKCYTHRKVICQKMDLT